MTKRIALNQMTQDNWNEEEDPEEAGLFEQAVDSRLQNRAIKKAKRRLPESKNGVPSSPFAKFAGFEAKKEPAKVTFNFLPTIPATNGNSHKSTLKADLPTPILASTKPSSNIVSTPVGTTRSGEESTSVSPDYLEGLKSLNTSFLGWVKDHLEKNAFCDFTPVCSDYIEHVKMLEKKLKSAESKLKIHPAGDSTPVSFKRALESKITPKFGIPQAKGPGTDSAKSFSSGSQTALSTSTDSKSRESSEKSASLFSFLSKPSQQGVSDTVASGSPFKPFTFARSQVPTSTTEPAAASEDKDDDNYVPPKNEVEPVKEPDAFYSKRCKLFYKKGENYVEKGIGILYLKKADDRIQLFVRADTVLGKFLLNIYLSDSLPIERLGKNNVLIVCIPDFALEPNSEPEPTPLLFRVKTTEDADELLDTLKDCIKSC